MSPACGNEVAVKLSVLVPVYNECARLREVLEFLFRSDCPIERQWIVIDDCSTDGSLKVLRNLQQHYGFLLIEREFNGGKGAAIIQGLSHASGDFVMIQDADFEYDPRDEPSLLEPLINGKADVVYGSRFKRSGAQVHRTFHYFGSRFLTMLSNVFSGIYLTDMETCYKIFPLTLISAMQLKSQRFGIEINLTAYLAKTSARVFELPTHYFPRTRKQGKKIGMRDAIAAVFHIIRFNVFTPFETAFKNIPLQFTPGRYRMPPHTVGILGTRA